MNDRINIFQQGIMGGDIVLLLFFGILQSSRSILDTHGKTLFQCIQFGFQFLYHSECETLHAIGHNRICTGSNQGFQIPSQSLKAAA